MLKQASVLMMWFISAFASALEVTPYIVNGSIVNISNYPSFASLFYRTATHYTPSSFCGATIINSRFVLTSAHCLQQDDEFLLHTVVSPNLEDESDFLSSAQAKAGAFYYPTSFVNSPNELWRDDIAIIELESPLPVDDLQYLLNSSINNNFPVNGEFYALGHGYINTDEPGGTELLKTQLSILSNTQCESVFGGKISDKQLCFGSPEVTGGTQNSICAGDSGGPVYYYYGGEYIQVGISSFGLETCGDPKYRVTSVFTDIYDYQGWINQVLNGEVEPKIYVDVQNGERVLVKSQLATSLPPGTSQLATQKSGGSFSLANVFGLLLLVVFSRMSIPLVRLKMPHSHK
ncbi:S1 family peptidase [Vibrio japonicus]|uniref:Trypsin-like serine protease n=1 Tax=Vibrio japonicus TaxID=1824638 RepID=A0ABY5LQM6_9VIBR|nr:trypsin-like serine protease [Vibrio japonicus]UUM33019.1 trypsin-like serine protease [Vibrio japonicus]